MKKVEKDYGFVSLDSESLISPVYIRISRKICTLHIRRHTGYYTKKIDAVLVYSRKYIKIC